MTHPERPNDDRDLRPSQSQQELFDEAILPNQTSSAPEEVAVPPVLPDIVDKEGIASKIRLKARVQGLAGDAVIDLNPELCSLLLFVILLLILEYITTLSPSDLAKRLDELARGRLPENIRKVISALVRDALQKCLGLPQVRRVYAASLLQPLPGDFLDKITLRPKALAATEDGYDLIMSIADGSVSLVPVAFPGNLFDEIIHGVLLAVARVITAVSDEEARGFVREVATGRPESTLVDSIAVAVAASISGAATLSERHKRAFLCLPSITELTKRAA